MTYPFVGSFLKFAARHGTAKPQNLERAFASFVAKFGSFTSLNLPLHSFDTFGPRFDLRPRRLISLSQVFLTFEKVRLPENKRLDASISSMSI